MLIVERQMLDRIEERLDREAGLPKFRQALTDCHVVRACWDAAFSTTGDPSKAVAQLAGFLAIQLHEAVQTIQQMQLRRAQAVTVLIDNVEDAARLNDANRAGAGFLFLARGGR